MDEVFRALADPSRRALLDALHGRGGQSLRELGEGLAMTRQAVAKHLGVLDAAGLVTPVRRGRETRYHLTPEAFTDAVGWIADVGGKWDRRLSKLQRLLDR